MLTISQMVIRLLIALALGALLGVERQATGKEAGVKTAMVVAGGAAIFSMIALSLPYLITPSSAMVPEIIARNGGFLGIIANIVLGVGFLGAGIILKNDSHVHGLTTAAVVWTTAAIGTLAGIGLTHFAVIATVLVVGLLYLLRKLNIDGRIHRSDAPP